MNNELLKKKIREAVDIARDLCYSKDVVERIMYAKTESQITRILKTARETC